MTEHALLAAALPNAGTWRRIDWWDGDPGVHTPYWVSSKGHVASLRNGIVRPLKGQANTNGYAQVTLRLHQRRWQPLVHTLVAAAFKGFRPESGLKIDHADRDHTNNAATNLRLVSQSENLRNRIGWAGRGGKLSAERIDGVCRALLKGATNAAAAEAMGVSIGSVRNIIAGRPPHPDVRSWIRLQEWRRRRASKA